MIPPLESLLTEETIFRLGWTLVHSLWQLAALAILAALALRLLRSARPNVRYLVSCSVLLAMGAAPAITFFSLTPPPVAEAPTTSTPDTTVLVETEAAPFGPLPAPPLALPPEAAPSPIPVPEGSPAAPVANPIETISTITPDSERTPTPVDASHAPTTAASSPLQEHLPWIVSLWLIGAALLAIWNLGGWFAALRLKVVGTSPMGSELTKTTRQLARRLGVRKSVRLCESALAQVPMVIGWLRPVILIPAGALAGLSASQLEAIIAHELAHIRRRDYLANLLQCVVETLLFYHPAAWWLSRRIRLEREHCCDDAAVSLAGDDPVTYAEALAHFEGQRASALAPAASGSGSTLSRIRRLLRVPDGSANQHPARWIGAAAALMLGTLMFSLSLTPASAQEERKAVKITAHDAASGLYTIDAGSTNGVKEGDWYLTEGNGKGSSPRLEVTKVGEQSSQARVVIVSAPEAPTTNPPKIGAAAEPYEKTARDLIPWGEPDKLGVRIRLRVPTKKWVIGQEGQGLVDIYNGGDDFTKAGKRGINSPDFFLIVNGQRLEPFNVFGPKTSGIPAGTILMSQSIPFNNTNWWTGGFASFISSHFWPLGKHTVQVGFRDAVSNKVEVEYAPPVITETPDLAEAIIGPQQPPEGFLLSAVGQPARDGQAGRPPGAKYASYRAGELDFVKGQPYELAFLGVGDLNALALAPKAVATVTEGRIDVTLKWTFHPKTPRATLPGIPVNTVYPVASTGPLTLKPGTYWINCEYENPTIDAFKERAKAEPFHRNVRIFPDALSAFAYPAQRHLTIHPDGRAELRVPLKVTTMTEGRAVFRDFGRQAGLAAGDRIIHERSGTLYRIPTNIRPDYFHLDEPSLQTGDVFFALPRVEAYTNDKEWGRGRTTQGQLRLLSPTWTPGEQSPLAFSMRLRAQYPGNSWRKDLNVWNPRITGLLIDGFEFIYEGERIRVVDEISPGARLPDRILPLDAWVPSRGHRRRTLGPGTHRITAIIDNKIRTNEVTLTVKGGEGPVRPPIEPPAAWRRIPGTQLEFGLSLESDTLNFNRAQRFTVHFRNPTNKAEALPDNLAKAQPRFFFVNTDSSVRFLARWRNSDVDPIFAPLRGLVLLPGQSRIIHYAIGRDESAFMVDTDEPLKGLHPTLPDGRYLISLDLDQGVTSGDLRATAGKPQQTTDALDAATSVVRREDGRIHRVTFQNPTRTALKDLGKVPEITSLSLTNCQELRDPDLSPLQKLGKLTTLRLNGADKLSSQGFSHLSNLGQLHWLHLTGSNFTDDAVAHLTKLERLVGLNLGHTKIGDQGMVSLPSLPQLKELDLSHTSITDDAVAQLYKMPRLRHLDLSNTSITDEGLIHFSKLFPLLTRLDLGGTKVSHEAMNELQKKRPKVRITRGERFFLNPDFEHKNGCIIAASDKFGVDHVGFRNLHIKYEDAREDQFITALFQIKHLPGDQIRIWAIEPEEDGTHRVEFRRYPTGIGQKPFNKDDLVEAFLAIPFGKFKPGHVQFNYTFRDENGKYTNLGSGGGSAAFSIKPAK